MGIDVGCHGSGSDRTLFLDSLSTPAPKTCGHSFATRTEQLECQGRPQLEEGFPSSSGRLPQVQPGGVPLPPPDAVSALRSLFSATRKRIGARGGKLWRPLPAARTLHRGRLGSNEGRLAPRRPRVRGHFCQTKMFRTKIFGGKSSGAPRPLQTRLVSSQSPKILVREAAAGTSK